MSKHLVSKRTLTANAREWKHPLLSCALVVEVHPDPVKTLSDGQQSLAFDKPAELLSEIEPMLGRLQTA